MSDIAFSLVVPIIAGFFIGQYFDSKYSGKYPLWTIICTLLGIITGMWSVYKRYIK